MANVRKQTKAQPTANAIGANLQRYRKECGWSFDQLVDHVYIDKKSAIAHVKGRAIPRPQNMKAYASAFSKKVGRDISVAELESTNKNRNFPKTSPKVR
jgi:hypothetical protein